MVLRKNQINLKCKAVFDHGMYLNMVQAYLHTRKYLLRGYIQGVLMHTTA